MYDLILGWITIFLGVVILIRAAREAMISFHRRKIRRVNARS